MAVTSPSYVLVHCYTGPIPVYHIDCYRLDTVRQFEDIGIDEFLYSRGIAIIEWGEKIKRLLPQETVYVTIGIRGEKKREFKVSSCDKKFQLTSCKSHVISKQPLTWGL